MEEITKFCICFLWSAVRVLMERIAKFYILFQV
jgi:hypothetical protein